MHGESDTRLGTGCALDFAFFDVSTAGNAGDRYREKGAPGGSRRMCHRRKTHKPHRRRREDIENSFLDEMEYLKGFGSASKNTGFNSGHYWTAPHRNITENHIDALNCSTVQLDALQKNHSDVQRRRKRTTFSKAQLVQLERTFSATQYPDSHTKETLSYITGLPESKIQVWFQNRRARYFKSKKASRKEPDPPKDLHPDYTFTSCPSFPELAPFHPPTPGLSSVPGCPAPSLPQSTRLSTILDRLVTQIPAPPPFYPPPSCSRQEDNYHQTLRPQHCHHVFPSEFDLPDDFEAVLREVQGSNPTVSSRWSAADNSAPTESIQSQMIHQNINRTELSNMPLLDLLADPTWLHPDVSSVTAYHLDC